jgi:hypothetical protein
MSPDSIVPIVVPIVLGLLLIGGLVLLFLILRRKRRRAEARAPASELPIPNSEYASARFDEGFADAYDSSLKMLP